MFLSIVIPAYNEAQRLPLSLLRIQTFLAAQPYLSEVIVVDDGSVDRTVAVVKEFQLQYRQAGIELRTIQNPGNQGKGYSVRQGMLQAQGEIAVFTDADLATPISETPRLIAPIINNQAEVVFGSRGLDPSQIKTHQPWLREFAGRSFNRFMRMATGLPFYDTQCGFKAFRRENARSAFLQQKIYGFGFDVEILFIAQKQGLRLLEMPVEWSDVAGSKVSIWTGSRAFSDVVQIWWNEVSGNYRSPAVISANSATSPETIAGQSWRR
jgi:dolichyl-phosphate beta-glucosyltransferase